MRAALENCKKKIIITIKPSPFIFAKILYGKESK